MRRPGRRPSGRAAWLLACGLLAWGATPAGAHPLERLLEDGAATPLERTGQVERYRWGGAELRLEKAPGPDETPTDPACRGGGVDLFVRGAVPDADTLAAVCARLEWDAPSLRRPAPVGVEVAPPPPRWPAVPAMGLLTGIAVAWWGLWLAAMPRRWEPWAIGAVAAGLRLLAGRAGPFMGFAYPYERMLTYAGALEPNPLYGGGWAAVAGAARAVLGAAPTGAYAMDGIVSVLTVVTLWAIVQRLADEDGPAHLAALGLAALPHAVSLGRTETIFVVAAGLQAAAVWGVSREDRLGDGLTALSVGLLAHTRPLQGLSVAAILGWALVRRRGVAVGVGALLAGARAVEVATLVRQAGEIPSGAGHLLAPDVFLQRQVGRGAANVLLDPWTTPAAVGLAAAVGAIRGPARVLGLFGLAAMVPYLHMWLTTDVLRFQLPAATWWCGLAGVGAWTTLHGRGRTAWGVAAGVAGVSWIVARAPQGGPLVFQAEHAAFVEAVDGAGIDAIVYDAGRDPHGRFADWAQAELGVRLVAHGTRPLRPGDRVWQGRVDRLTGGDPLAGCRAEATFERTLDPRSGGLLSLGDAPVRAVLWTVTACP